MTPLFAIVGPTATGKTALAIEVARRLGGEIVSVDSAQVFRRLDVGTAKPTAEERAQVPHHLIDVLEPSEQWTAAHYAERARAAIDELRARGRVPIVCGGTGLWLRALVYGVFEAEPIPAAVREEVRASIAREGSEAAHTRLLALDPTSAARLHPNDAQRVGRALEYVLTTGASIALRQDAHGFRSPRYRLIAVAPRIERGELWARIERRTRAMYDGGLVEETAAELARSGPDAPGLRIIGYRDALALLAGRLDRAAAIERTILDTRRYAKRQRNWFQADPELMWWDNPYPDRVAEHFWERAAPEA